VDEDDNVAEEKRDPAPPVKEKAEEAPADEAPAPPTRGGGGSTDLRSRLERITKKGQ
jgi:hypothetical protein